MSDGCTIAIKRLHFLSLTGGQDTAAGERDFQAEATIIARVHHKHLVQLVGFCTNAQERILVLEYMKNGSLADTLYGEESKRKMEVSLPNMQGIIGHSPIMVNSWLLAS